MAQQPPPQQPPPQPLPWTDKVGNPGQLGGIETAVLDNGLARGTRIAWVNTGSPLRYKIAIDRGLDIVDAFYSQHSIAWLSHGGLTAPRPDSQYGTDWLQTFPGGLLTTCGLTHMGAPSSTDQGDFGLHGRVSNTPAEITAIQQPQLHTGQREMSLSAIIRESCVFGPALELHRTIRSTLGEPTIRIHDTIINAGNQPAPHMLLYHCNFGWPLVDEQTEIIYDGPCRSRGFDDDNAIFDDGHNYRKACPPLDSHRGTGEACGFIDPSPDTQGLCHAALHNPALGLTVTVTFRKDQLPHLANWQHWGPGEYVTGLEPGTHPPVGRAQVEQENTMIHLDPGQSRDYDLEITIDNNH